jgi:hypothetical protein
MISSNINRKEPNSAKQFKVAAYLVGVAAVVHSLVAGIFFPIELKYLMIRAGCTLLWFIWPTILKVLHVKSWAFWIPVIFSLILLSKNFAVLGFLFLVSIFGMA